MRDNSDLIASPHISENKLYKMLYDNLPNHRSHRTNNTLNVEKIADDLGISSKAIYAWFARGSLSSRQVKKLIDLDGSTLTSDELIEHLP